MLSDRKALVLRTIIEEFVNTAEPVGSKGDIWISLNCSSATIRNEMAALEDLGYLEKTHTSSGRIPSEHGYRYYVDHILRINDPLNTSFPKVDEILGSYILGNDDVINRALKMISELTNYTSMILGPSNSSSLVKKIELVKIAPNEALIIIITDTGHVEKRKLFLDGHKMDDLQNVVRILNEFLVNVPVGDISKKLSFELKSTELKEYLKYHQTLIEAFMRAFSKFNEEQRFVSGQYNLLYEPEFNDINKVRSFIEALDKQEIFSIIDKTSKGLTVKIGSENRLQFMENCAIISIPYQVPTGETGTIAVVGPKRMNYRKVIPLLEYIAMNMSDFDK